jgi:superfamily II DNA helicase RecQ
MFELRPYQAEAKQAILAAWDEGYRKTLLVLPTGTARPSCYSTVSTQKTR